MMMDFTGVQEDERLVKAIARIKNEAFSQVLVFRGKKLVGFFSPDFVARSRINVYETKLQKHIKRISIISEEAEVEQIAWALFSSGNNIVALGSKNTLKGVRNIIWVLNELLPSFENMKVSLIPLTETSKISKSERIGKALNILRENKSNILLVEDDGILNSFPAFDFIRNINFLSHERDWGFKPKLKTKAFKSEIVDIDSLPVHNFIAYKNKTVLKSSAWISEAIELMSERNVLHVIIEDKKSILTAGDILKAYFTKQIEFPFYYEILGFSSLNVDPFTKYEIESIIFKFCKKLKRYISKETRLKIHIKTYKSKTSEKRHKFSLNVHLINSSGQVFVGRAHGWDLKSSLL